MPDLSSSSASFIAELDAAVEAHMNWTRRVLRCVVLCEPPGEDVLAPSAHTLCRFGSWFVQNRDWFEQINAQDTRSLETVHQAMHDAIRSICEDVLAGRPGQSLRLEDFEQTQAELIRLLAGFKTGFLVNAVQFDPLTGLPLRYGIEHKFELMHGVCKRNRLLLFVMMIDADHFKQINDTFGHPVGDIALCHLADVLKRTKRGEEPLYRFGGEEFLLLMHVKSHDEATHAAQRFVDAVRNAPLPISREQSLNMSVTLGLSCVGDDEDLASAIKRADKALYQGKWAGRDRYVIADD
jgi:diguanylate cyclase